MEFIQGTEWTRLTGELGFGVGIKSRLDFVIVDSEGQTSDVTDDWSVEFGRCRGGHDSWRSGVGSLSQLTSDWSRRWIYKWWV